LAQPGQDEFALFAARHFGAKQLEDERIGRLANSPDCRVGSLSFQATQASAIDKSLWILAWGAQPSSAIRLLAKLKTIEKPMRRRPSEGRRSAHCKPPKAELPSARFCRIRTSLNRTRSVDLNMILEVPRPIWSKPQCCQEAAPKGA
jgi:hypothetical protein